MVQGLGFAVAAALILTGPAAAQSSTTVLGGGMAEACSNAARAYVRAKDRQSAGADGAWQTRRIGLTPAIDGVQACDRALVQEPLNTRDLAATYVNRGVLLMARAAFDSALADFDAGLRVRPNLAEAHANRGGALVALHRYREGADEITRGLALNTEEPEKSYYNRAVALERLDDPKGAYFDYLKALELRPDWADPKIQLERFSVTRR